MIANPLQILQLQTTGPVTPARGSRHLARPTGSAKGRRRVDRAGESPATPVDRRPPPRGSRRRIAGYAGC
jgi:hypothetical protein